ncbi:MAG: C40 family peptidase, partial [Nitrospirae bacterium]|nr:C40 family peptidase [Nitrospirota bacterium]
IGMPITLPPRSSEKNKPLLAETKKHGIEKQASSRISKKAKSVSASRRKPITSLTAETLRENYTVKSGDTLYEIARSNNISVKELKRLNNLKKSSLKPGQKLILPAQKTEEIIAELKKDHIEALSLNTLTTEESASVVEGETGAEPVDKQERLIVFAKKFLNIPYKFGGTSLFGIDCSAFVQKVFNLMNVSLPRTAREQFNVGSEVQKEDLSVGDLVFFKTYASFPSHVGIYIGDNLFIHASSKDKKVTVNSIYEPYYTKRFLGAKRLIEPQEEIKEN